MSMFGSKIKQQSAPAQAQRDDEKYHESIDWQPLIDAERERLLRVSEDNRKLFAQAHADDLARFRLDAVAQGGFVLITIHRPHPDDLIRRLNEEDEKFPDRIGSRKDEPDSGIETQAINVAGARSIVVKKGHQPDDGTSVEIQCRRTQDNQSFWASSGGSSGGTLIPGGEPEARGLYWAKLTAYERFEEITVDDAEATSYYDPISRGTYKYTGPSRPAPEKVSGLARPALDDQIIFTRINMKIYVPAGLGEAMRDKILASLSNPPPPAP